MTVASHSVTLTLTHVTASIVVEASTSAPEAILGGVLGAAGTTLPQAWLDATEEAPELSVIEHGASLS